MSLGRRIASALAASAFGQLVTIGSQVLLTPVYFLQWGAEQYGEWLLLSGIPAYIAMADAGIGSAAGNDMTVRVGAGDVEGAQRTFRGALIVAGGAGILAIILGALFCAVFVNTTFLHLNSLGGAYGAKVLMVLSVYVALNFMGGILYNGFKCSGRNALGLTLANLARLAEAVTIAVVLIMHQPPMIVAISMLSVKLLNIMANLAVLRIVCRWLFSPRVPADTKLLQRLIVPALAFLAFPMSNALQLQGPLLILGLTMNGAAVATFSAFRTIARIPLQFTNVINSSVWPEVSLAYGARDMRLLRKIHSTTIAAASYGGFAMSGGILLFGATIMHHWLHGQVEYDRLLMSGLLLSTVISAIWNASSIVLSATNQHVGYSAVLMAVSIGSFLANYPAAHYLQLYGIAAVMVLTEASMAVFVINRSLTVCSDTKLGLVVGVLNAPRQMAEAMNKKLASGAS